MVKLYAILCLGVCLPCVVVSTQVELENRTTERTVETSQNRTQRDTRATHDEVEDIECSTTGNSEDNKRPCLHSIINGDEVPIVSLSNASRIKIAANDKMASREAWKVSVFRKKDKNIERVCGGSLVTITAVISAARCFWDAGPLPAKQFAVKFRGTLKPVRDIKIPPNFHGASDYQDDIAVLLVNRPFQLYGFLRPVCVSLDSTLEEKQLEGLAMCMKDTSRQHGKYIDDERCAGINFPRNVDTDDLGSGVAFSLGSNPIPLLRGIALLRLMPAHSTDAFTRVSAHSEFLLQHIPGLEKECARWYPQLAAQPEEVEEWGDEGVSDDGHLAALKAKGRGDEGVSDGRHSAEQTEGSGDEGVRIGRGESNQEEQGQFVCNCYC